MTSTSTAALAGPVGVAGVDQPVALAHGVVDDRDRGGRAEVVVHRVRERRRQRGRPAVVAQRRRPLEEALDPAEAGRRLVERLEAELDVRAVVGRHDVEPQLDPADPLEHGRDQQRVAERLAHLLAGGGDPGVVHPVRRERVPGRAGLGLLVLVVREAQVDAAAVDVERGAEVLLCHRGALDVPAGTARTPRRRPGGGRRLGLLLPALPQREVARVALAARVGVPGGLHVVDLLVRELAVLRPGADVEVDVAGAVLGGVRVPAHDQLGDQLDHLRDVAGGAGLVRRRQHVDRGQRLVELAVHGVGEVVPGTALLRGLGQDLVVDVGDVADERDVVAGAGQPAPQHVEVDRRPDVPDVRLRLDRQAAHVDARLPLLEGNEVTDFAGRGVVQPEGHPPKSRVAAGACPHRGFV